MKKIFIICLTLFISTAQAYSFGFKKDKSKPQAKEPVEISEYDNYGSGYVGTLPDIKGQFSSSEPEAAKPEFEKTKKFNSSNELKPVPRDNPAFVNIILKTDKKSPYVNDMNELLPQLENMLFCIENNYDVQKFNAKVHFFTQTMQYLQEKYDNKPESSYASFQKLLVLRTHSQSVATLRSEAEKYRPYLAYTGAGYLYNDNVINEQLDYLKTEIEETIVMIKEIE